jgi:hypothetical protein
MPKRGCDESWLKLAGAQLWEVGASCCVRLLSRTRASKQRDTLARLASVDVDGAPA